MMRVPNVVLVCVLDGEDGASEHSDHSALLYSPPPHLHLNVILPAKIEHISIKDLTSDMDAGGIFA